MDPDHTQCRFGQEKDRARKQRRRESRAEEPLAVVLAGAKDGRPGLKVCAGDFSGEKCVLAVLAARAWETLVGMMPLSSPDAGSCGEGARRDLCQNGVAGAVKGTWRKPTEESWRRRGPGTGNNQRR